VSDDETTPLQQFGSVIAVVGAILALVVTASALALAAAFVFDILRPGFVEFAGLVASHVRTTHTAILTLELYVVAYVLVEFGSSLTYGRPFVFARTVAYRLRKKAGGSDD